MTRPRLQGCGCRAPRNIRPTTGSTRPPLAPRRRCDAFWQTWRTVATPSSSWPRQETERSALSPASCVRGPRRSSRERGPRWMMSSSNLTIVTAVWAAPCYRASVTGRRREARMASPCRSQRPTQEAENSTKIWDFGRSRCIRCSSLIRGFRYCIDPARRGPRSRASGEHAREAHPYPSFPRKRESTAPRVALL
jgi:hypothetical protein